MPATCNFGPAATLDGNLAEDYLDFRREWFDRWLRPENAGADDVPAVRYFRMGGGSGNRTSGGRLAHGGSWQTAASWPVPNTEFRAYYLHADGILATDAPADGESSLGFDFDPANPVPTIGGTITSLLLACAAGCLRSAYRPEHLRRAASLPAARGAPRRAGLPDRTVGRGHRNHRADHGPPVDLVRCPGYRFHGQADRLAATQRRLPAGLRHEPDRRHPALPLSQVMGKPRVPATRRDRRDRHRTDADLQLVRARPSHPNRHFQQQLPAV